MTNTPLPKDLEAAIGDEEKARPNPYLAKDWDGVQDKGDNPDA